MDKDLIIVKDTSGVEKNFYKLAEFSSDITKKDYIMYTDNNYTNNKLNIYCSIITKKDDKIMFDNLEREEDKKEFDKALDELLEIINKKNSSN